MEAVDPSPESPVASGNGRNARRLIAVVLLVFAVAGAYFAMGGFEKPSPRLALLRRSWGTIAEGTPEATLVGLFGKPDADHAVVEKIPACIVPCPQSGQPAPTPCTEFHTCVRSVSWYSHPEGTSGTSYTACLDDQGIARRLSEGSYMQFNMAHF
jgi:hypothetical protein